MSTPPPTDKPADTPSDPDKQPGDTRDGQRRGRRRRGGRSSSGSADSASRDDANKDQPKHQASSRPAQAKAAERRSGSTSAGDEAQSSQTPEGGRGRAAGEPKGTRKQAARSSSKRSRKASRSEAGDAADERPAVDAEAAEKARLRALVKARRREAASNARDSGSATKKRATETSGKQPRTGDTAASQSKPKRDSKPKPDSKPTAKAGGKTSAGRGKPKAAGKQTERPAAVTRDPESRPAPRRPAVGGGGGGGVMIGGGKAKKKKGRTRQKTDELAPPVATEREVFRGLTLNDFQMAALGPLREGRPVLLAAPTGAGKTLVAELAIQMSLDAGKRAIYTAPIKALSNQKFRDFKAIDPDMVGLMTGDVTLNPGAPVLIMTTEIFRNTILENPASLSDVDTVVFDEIHYMDDMERGTVWEESIIFAPKHIRFVCLSATISNLAQYGEWISQVRGKEVEVVRHTERPVPLDHYLFFPTAGLRRLDGTVRFPSTHLKAMSRRGGRQQQGAKDRNGVLEPLVREGKLPCLFFCFSRKDCERRALETSSKRDLLEPDEATHVEGLFDEVCALFEIEPDAELEELRSLVRRGIGYHHAGMLPLHKEIIERLFTSGLLRLLFATETFSLGINMPARTVVFASLRKFDGTGFGPLKVRDYQQMAGRAGRQGIDESGTVISIVDDHRVQPGDVERMISNDVEPVVSRFNLSYSTLINLHRSLGERLHEAWERSFNNYQWSRMSRKKREKNEEKQHLAIDRRMRLLRELEYITDEGVTPKGELAARINGYELQVTELFHSGLLEWLDEVQIAVVFAAITFEERKNDLFRRLPTKVMGPHRKDVENVVDLLVQKERELGIPPTVRPPNFKIGIVVHDWCRGASFADMSEHTTAPNGDLVRVMRLTVQLLRQMRSNLPERHKLIPLVDRARDLLNRSEVDAARQLSLG